MTHGPHLLPCCLCDDTRQTPPDWRPLCSSLIMTISVIRCSCSQDALRSLQKPLTACSPLPWPLTHLLHHCLPARWPYNISPCWKPNLLSPGGLKNFLQWIPVAPCSYPCCDNDHTAITPASKTHSSPHCYVLMGHSTHSYCDNNDYAAHMFQFWNTLYFFTFECV